MFMLYILIEDAVEVKPLSTRTINADQLSLKNNVINKRIVSMGDQYNLVATFCGVLSKG